MRSVYIFRKKDGYGIPYAYTTTKRFAKYFKATRNMKKFIITKEKMTDEVISYLKEYSLAELKTYEVLTRDNDMNIIKVPLICPREEYESVTSLFENGLVVNVWDSLKYHPKIFSKKYQSALYAIGYYSFYYAKHYPNLSIPISMKADIISIIAVDFKDTFK